MYSPHSPTLSSTFGDHRSFVSANHHLHQSPYQLYQHSPNSVASSGHHNQQQQQQNGHFISSPYSPASFSTTLTSNSTSQHTAPMTAGGNMSAGHLSTLATSNHHHHHHHHSAHNHLQQKTSVQCLRFKYFTTFFVSTACLVLLSASLATHKWLVARPIRQLRMINGQRTNFTALMLTLESQEDNDDDHRRPVARAHQAAAAQVRTPPPPSPASQDQQTSDQAVQAASNKFQGAIYFGLFNGVKVLNYGFGDRVSQLSVAQAYLNGAQKQQEQGAVASAQQQPQTEPLINFKFWLMTLAGVSLAILFALVGSIFAIINFVMTPRGTMSGPAGLVIWNAAACFSCLLAIFAWLAEYYLRLKSNVLTHEEIQNGWTSENRSQFGYSYYFVVLAFCLHLVNIFIVSIVQSETWTSSASCSKTAAKRQARSACDGVIMLY